MSNGIEINWDIFGFELSIALSLILLVSCAISYVFWLRIIDLENKLDLQKKELESRQEYLIDQARTNERLLAEQRIEEVKANGLSVVVHPFVNTEADKGIFIRSTKVEVGYKYQLFIQGFPCFEPHTVVLESTVHKEVDQQMLDLLKQKAEGAAEAAVQIPSGGAAKTAITIAKTLLKLARK
jgi:hypothetical protein